MTKDRNRRSVSIEQLLIWAYHDQMVHQAQRGTIGSGKGRGPVVATSSVWNEGSPVQASQKQGFEAAEDAWRIHDQVMKLARITVDCGHDLAAARYHMLGQYRGLAPPLSVASTVDRTAQSWPTDGLLDIDLRMLVIINASKAIRPEHPVEPDFRFKPGPIVRHPSQKGGVYQRGWYNHVSAEGVLPGDAVMAFEQYRVWRNALIRLNDTLRGLSLTMWSVTGDLPPQEQKPSLRA